LQRANLRNERLSCKKLERADIPEENTCGSRSLSLKIEKRPDIKEISI
jgi:hypothetical protein